MDMTMCKLPLENHQKWSFLVTFWSRGYSFIHNIDVIMVVKWPFFGVSWTGSRLTTILPSGFHEIWTPKLTCFYVKVTLGQSLTWNSLSLVSKRSTCDRVLPSLTVCSLVPIDHKMTSSINAYSIMVVWQVYNWCQTDVHTKIHHFKDGSRTTSCQYRHDLRPWQSCKD